MKLRLTPLNAKSQHIENLNDLVLSQIDDISKDVIFVHEEDTKKIVETNRRLMEVSIITGKVFVFIPGDVKFFRLQIEKVGEHEKTNQSQGE